MFEEMQFRFSMLSILGSTKLQASKVVAITDERIVPENWLSRRDVWDE